MLLRTLAALLTASVLSVSVAACSSDDDAAGSTSSATGEQFPDVVKAEISGDPGGPYSFAVTMTSPYDSAERYADGMRVRSVDGDVFGERTLTHDHASEQPFTRDITDVEIPDGITEVIVEGRDQESGWGGDTVTVQVP